MSAFTNLKSPSSIFRGKTPGLAELCALVNLLPEAAILVHAGQRKIVAVNPLLTKLTAFPANAFSGAPLDNLIPNSEQLTLAHGEKRLVNVLRLKRSPLAVELQVTGLDPAANWAVVCLAPSQRQSVSNWQERLLTGFRAMGMVSDFESLESYLEKALSIIQDLLDTAVVCVYQARPDGPGLRKIAGRESQVTFPPEIPPTDLIRLQTALTWYPGKRVQTEIHRAGRQAELNYVSSFPLGRLGACDGLLVVADNEKQPVESLTNILGVFSSLIGQALEHFILKANLNADLASKQAQLFIHQVMLENSQNGIIVLDPELKVVNLNPAIQSMLGYSLNDATGLAADSILVGASHLAAALQAAQAGVGTQNINEAKVRSRDGSSFPAKLQVAPVLEADRVQAILVYVMDVGELEQIRARLQQLEQRAELGEVMAMFAHEVRNPINNISLALQFLASRFPESDANQDVISQAMAECTRLDHLMENVLAYARPMEQRFEIVDLGLLARMLMERQWTRFERYNITPFVHAVEGTPAIKGDPRALERVFINLINNAIEAMRSTGGSLSINVGTNFSTPNNPLVEVTVADNGPGIPDELRDHIFEPFVTNKKGGTGLGLSITQGIVSAHKGSISVNSIPGATIFTLSFPADFAGAA